MTIVSIFLEAIDSAKKIAVVIVEAERLDYYDSFLAARIASKKVEDFFHFTAGAVTLETLEAAVETAVSAIYDFVEAKRNARYISWIESISDEDRADLARSFGPGGAEWDKIHSEVLHDQI